MKLSAHNAIKADNLRLLLAVENHFSEKHKHKYFSLITVRSGHYASMMAVGIGRSKARRKTGRRCCPFFQQGRSAPNLSTITGAVSPQQHRMVMSAPMEAHWRQGMLNNQSM